MVESILSGPLIPTAADRGRIIPRRRGQGWAQGHTGHPALPSIVPEGASELMGDQIRARQRPGPVRLCPDRSPLQGSRHACGRARTGAGAHVPLEGQVLAATAEASGLAAPESRPLFFPAFLG